MKAKDLIPAGIVGLVLMLLARMSKRSGMFASDLEAREEGWSHPLPVLFVGIDAYRPTVSDGPGVGRRDGGTRDHEGADVMYRRKTEDDQRARWPARQPDGSEWHFMPSDVPVRAARDGTVWDAGKSERGHWVQLVHDKGQRATFYTHMSVSGRVGVDMKLKPWKRGDKVKRGDVLGIVGDDPKNPGDPRHLHFELWRWNGATKSWDKVDPTAALAAWPTDENHNV